MSAPPHPDPVRSYEIRGKQIRVAGSHGIIPTVVHELQVDDYGLRRIRFAPGDVVIDIGGHIGLFSIYLAKCRPDLKILSFEPVESNYQDFVKNLSLNGVENVHVEHSAVTADGRTLELAMHESNTGGATSNLRDLNLIGHTHHAASSTTLDAIFARHQVSRCKLLKIDCEGSEHEILTTARCLDRIEWLSGEFHINSRLESEGYSIDGLVRHLERFIPRRRLRYQTCRMAE